MQRPCAVFSWVIRGSFGPRTVLTGYRVRSRAAIANALWQRARGASRASGPPARRAPCWSPNRVSVAATNERRIISIMFNSRYGGVHPSVRALPSNQHAPCRFGLSHTRGLAIPNPGAAGPSRANARARFRPFLFSRSSHNSIA